jgi:SAM-dependent methyltransferase
MSQSIKAFKDELSWEEKAQRNPLFAIMSDEEFEQSGGVPSEAQLTRFFQRGRQIWDQLLEGSFALAKEKNGDSPLKVAEYGCGMGRTLAIPASEGNEVLGLDISPTQIELAKTYFPYPDKISFHQILPKTPIGLPDGSLHYIYSYAVFQHIIHTSDVHFAFKELARLLHKSGVLLIQVRGNNKFQSKFQRFGFTSWNSEDASLLFYFRKVMGIPFPVVRNLKHTNWTGAGCYVPYEDYIEAGQNLGMKLNSIKFSTGNQSMVWLEFVKS